MRVDEAIARELHTLRINEWKSILFTLPEMEPEVRGWIEQYCGMAYDDLSPYEQEDLLDTADSILGAMKAALVEEELRGKRHHFSEV